VTGVSQLVVVRDPVAASPRVDAALSRVLLARAQAGGQAPILRLVRPGRALAFGPADRRSPGYAAARRAALDHGLEPVARLAGGRAVVLHEDTLALEWTVPAPRARDGIRDRYLVMTSVVVTALRRLGVDACTGKVPGEYCPGTYSINARGRVKVAGFAQRVVTGAAQAGGLLVVGGAEDVRRPLGAVYAALGVAWDPATVGSVRDEVGATSWDDVADALIKALRERFAVEERALDADVLARARHADVDRGGGRPRDRVRAG